MCVRFVCTHLVCAPVPLPLRARDPPQHRRVESKSCAFLLINCLRLGGVVDWGWCKKVSGWVVSRSECLHDVRVYTIHIMAALALTKHPHVYAGCSQLNLQNTIKRTIFSACSHEGLGQSALISLATCATKTINRTTMSHVRRWPPMSLSLRRRH